VLKAAEEEEVMVVEEMEVEVAAKQDERSREGGVAETGGVKVQVLGAGERRQRMW